MARLRKRLKRLRKRVRKGVKRGRKRGLLKRVGFGSRRGRKAFFDFTPKGRALRPFAKMVGLA